MNLLLILCDEKNLCQVGKLKKIVFAQVNIFNNIFLTS